jgi:hypothetical protein
MDPRRTASALPRLMLALASMALPGSLDVRCQESRPQSRPAAARPQVRIDDRATYTPFDSRWFIEPPEYEVNEPRDPWNPYRQNQLKGDFPIFGTDDLFFALTATERLLFEFRKLPTPTGITGPQPGKEEFFGEGDQYMLKSQTAVSLELFKGQRGFKPVDWLVKVTPVYDFTELAVREKGVVRVDNAQDRTRTTQDFALQEALVEIHLFNLSPRYDFISTEIGILPFRSDFRSFIFDDSNLGWRIFGNADENKWQYNLAAFSMLEKNTNSELNTFEDRDQVVVVANLYRQDFPVPGFTSQVSFHYNNDGDSVHFDRNGALVRPAPVGAAQPHRVEAYYVGYAGDGHLGPVNVTTAFYHAFGREGDNVFAAGPTQINANMAALEVSYDIDWFRPKVYGFYASGDGNPRDNEARGFDAILDAPAFAGGSNSLWNLQSIKLLGVNLVQRQSLLPDLASSKLEGQSNFVNPGILILGAAGDFELTPTWRAQVGSNWLAFQETAVLETYLEVEQVSPTIGQEFFIGTQYRPLLTNNVVFNFGAAALFPGNGLEKIYQSDQEFYSVFLEMLFTW